MKQGRKTAADGLNEEQRKGFEYEVTELVSTSSGFRAWHCELRIFQGTRRSNVRLERVRRHPIGVLGDKLYDLRCLAETRGCLTCLTFSL